VRALVAAAGALAVAGGAYLLTVEAGPLALGYAMTVAALAMGAALWRLGVWLPAPDEPGPALWRRSRAIPDPAPRPAAVLDWEAMIRASGVRGWSDHRLAARLAPLAAELLAERRGLGPDDAGAVEALGPVWVRLRDATRHAGHGDHGLSLDEIEDLTARLEQM
jgi:hypothetical protein